MSFKDILIAISVAVIWGINFSFVKLGLQGMPPLLLAAFRFILLFFPACFFIRPPKIPLKLLLGYSITINFGQFALLFYAIHIGVPSGVSALVLQSQVFFTVFLGVIFFKEKIKAYQYAGFVIAIIGIFLLIEGSMVNHDVAIPLFGLILALLAGLAWATGNIFNKKILHLEQRPSMASLLVWGALPTAILFVAASGLLEGQTAIVDSLVHISLPTISAILYLTVAASVIGYGCWGYLLGKYPTNHVSPFGLIIPVVGLIMGYILFNEVLSSLQLAGVIAVMLGLLINLFGGKLTSLISR